MFNLDFFRLARNSVLGLSSAVILAFAIPAASAHHSATAYDEEGTASISGTVEKLIWRNPHVVIELAVANEAGVVETWPLETAGIQNLIRAGWDKDKVSVGKQLDIEIHPMKSGAPGGILRWVTLQSGEVLAIDSEAPQSYAASGGVAPIDDPEPVSTPSAGLVLSGDLEARAAESREDALSRRSEWERLEADIRPDTLPLVAEGGAAGALDPDNLENFAGSAVFDFSGVWSHRASREQSLERGGMPWHFLPPPTLTPKAQLIYDDTMARREAGDPTADPATLCYPHGLPRIMTRIGNMMLLQESTALFMVHRMNNDYRAIFMDGRDHVDPSIRVDSYNGDSIAFWEDDALYVETIGFGQNNHFVQEGIPIGAQGKIVERWRLVNDGNTLEIEYRMTDPEHWVGEWVDVKFWDRIHGDDIYEARCILAEEGSLAGVLDITGSSAAASSGDSSASNAGKERRGGFMLPLLFGFGLGFGFLLILPEILKRTNKLGQYFHEQ